ncbi:NPCBM/NEW2 domain-containing protein [Kitasatospora sp. NPDC048365]|uniref:NPCBM/NEW2 domain-containing protein n=1 Tax=Kitasatospora sp. NPDC048365 TaxID=3364050 RepID=UPI003711DAC7
MAWISDTNGWGPVERNTSNGRKASGDGTPISLDKTVYSKGLGVHADSEIVYWLARRFTRFTAVVGIDDFSANQSNQGSVVAEVWVDGRKAFDSGVLTAATKSRKVDVDLTGVSVLRLVVRDSGNGYSYDHTSWANAFVRHI